MLLNMLEFIPILCLYIFSEIYFFFRFQYIGILGKCIFPKKNIIIFCVIFKNNFKYFNLKHLSHFKHLLPGCSFLSMSDLSSRWPVSANAVMAFSCNAVKWAVGSSFVSTHSSCRAV